MMQQVFQFVSVLISIYMVIIFFRIVLTWIRGVQFGRAQEFLATLTDPYLNWFRRHIPIRFGNLDFSPVVGILVLGLLNNIATQLAFAGEITFGYVLAMIISAVWSVVSFFLTFFLILGGIRLIGVVGGFDTGGRFWAIVEQIVNPALHTVVRPFLRGRFTNYRDSLLIFCVALVGVLIVGRLLANLLISLAGSIPI